GSWPHHSAQGLDVVVALAPYRIHDDDPPPKDPPFVCPVRHPRFCASPVAPKGSRLLLAPPVVVHRDQPNETRFAKPDSEQLQFSRPAAERAHQEPPANHRATVRYRLPFPAPTNCGTAYLAAAATADKHLRSSLFEVECGLPSLCSEPA